MAQSLGRLITAGGSHPPLHLEDLITRVQQQRGLTLAPEQTKAVAAALMDKVLVITGGPGTGKTTIVSCILDLYQGLGARVLLMAPTGRAAKRLSETTGMTATTIHRALEFSPQTGGFRRGPAEPLKAEVVVVDETSMVDTLPDVPPAAGGARHGPPHPGGGRPPTPGRGPGKHPQRPDRLRSRQSGPPHPHLPSGQREPHRGERPPHQSGGIPLSAPRSSAKTTSSFWNWIMPRPSRPGSWTWWPRNCPGAATGWTPYETSR